ncbi:MAG: helix-turn-helix transcriptional regulator [Clostridia bacterium]|nr:helix-turn-helix transcriptional regulator [Clostridia bacterium]
MSTEKSSVQHRLKELRQQYKLTQTEIAAKINCSQRIYSDYEIGRYDISTETLISIAKIYRVSTDYILGISDK